MSTLCTDIVAGNMQPAEEWCSEFSDEESCLNGYISYVNEMTMAEERGESSGSSYQQCTWDKDNCKNLDITVGGVAYEVVEFCHFPCGVGRGKCENRPPYCCLPFEEGGCANLCSEVPGADGTLL